MTPSKKKKKEKVYTKRISTTVSSETDRKYQEWNGKAGTDDKITWAECIRRGFYSLLREKQGMTLVDLADDNADYIPIAIRDRITKLADMSQNLNKQLLVLQNKTDRSIIKK